MVLKERTYSNEKEMMTVRRYSILMFSLLGMFLLLAGCGDDKITFEGKNGEEVSLDLGDMKDGEFSVDVEGEKGKGGSFSVSTSEDGESGTVKIKTEDGKMAMKMGSGEVPEALPADFPLPDDAKVLFSSTVKQKKGMRISVQFKTEQKAKAVYESAMAYAKNKGLKIETKRVVTVNGKKSFTLSTAQDNEANEHFTLTIGGMMGGTASVNYFIPM